MSVEEEMKKEDKLEKELKEKHNVFIELTKQVIGIAEQLMNDKLEIFDEPKDRDLFYEFLTSSIKIHVEETNLDRNTLRVFKNVEALKKRKERKEKPK